MSNPARWAACKGRKTAREKEKPCGRNITDMDIRSAQAIRLAPNNYIEAQNWLKTTGRMASDNMY